MPLSVLGPHLVIGAIVLCLFWGTMAVVKGSAVHKRLGRLYLLSLAPVLISVVPISLYLAQRTDPAHLFTLAYLALVVATAAWTAWRAIRDRNASQAFRGWTFRLLACAMFASGAVLLVLGAILQRPLTIGFSAIGLVYGGAMLLELEHPPQPLWWKAWHINGISLLFVATHASFVGIVARTLWPSLAGEAMHTLTQLGVLTLGLALRIWLGRRYLSARSRQTPAQSFPPSAAVEAG